METTPLSTYLRDHLAGSVAAITLLDGLSRKYRNRKLGIFALELRDEIQKDQQVLIDLIDDLGGRSSFKEGVAWVAEKFSRLKLVHHSSEELAVLESLEALSLGILGKRALWRSLLQVSSDSRLRERNFEDLIRRAEEQYEKVEMVRLERARIAFADARPTSTTARPAAARL